jgi:hypothetical protein
MTAVGAILMLLGFLGMLLVLVLQVTSEANLNAIMVALISGFVFLAGAVLTASGALGNKLAHRLGDTSKKENQAAEFSDEIYETPDGKFTYRDRTFQKRSSAEEYKHLVKRLLNS